METKGINDGRVNDSSPVCSSVTLFAFAPLVAVMPKLVECVATSRLLVWPREGRLSFFLSRSRRSSSSIRISFSISCRLARGAIEGRVLQGGVDCRGGLGERRGAMRGRRRRRMARRNGELRHRAEQNRAKSISVPLALLWLVRSFIISRCFSPSSRLRRSVRPTTSRRPTS